MSPARRAPPFATFYKSPRGAGQIFNLYILPCRVQGSGAAIEIAQAVDTANRLQPALDVIVVTRGGGSAEDLWAFNEEPVVRAVANSRLPVLSAIGHEIDLTLCDLAADVRALTPSEAGELVVSEKRPWVLALEELQQRLVNGLQSNARLAKAKLNGVGDPPRLATPHRSNTFVGRKSRRARSPDATRHESGDQCRPSSSRKPVHTPPCHQPAASLVTRLQRDANRRWNRNSTKRSGPSGGNHHDKT